MDDERNTAGANLLAVGVLGILGVLVVPLPGAILDALLAVSVGLAVLVLLVSLRVRRPLDFSVFPSMLLIVTLFRLGLNVATTRLILLKGGEGDGATGHIIQAFGEFAVGGSVIVGAVVFLILLVVNFMVITKGSGRISEVAARFTLDALPGKQMAIDADLAAGAITDKEAQQRRTALAEEAEFFGAMDGASKFVRGDAVAGLVITAINIVGGLLAGLLRDNLGFGQAVSTYTVLTIGDGLVSQMPALFISTAAGVVITKAGNKDDLGRQLAGQVLGSSQVLLSVAAVLLVIGLLPGMPFLAFLALAIGALVLSRRAKNRERTKVPDDLVKKKGVKGQNDDAPDRMEDLLALDSLEVELGMGLLSLLDRSRQGASGAGELPGRVTSLRRQLAADLGIVLPPVHLKDSLGVGANEYRVLLRGMEIATGTAYGDRFMVLDPGGDDPDIPGVRATEPTFGLPARWVLPADRGKAEELGFSAIDPASVVTTHLAELLRKNAAELVGRQEVQELLNVVGKDAPKLVEEVVPGVVTLGQLAQVVRGLLVEGIGVRDFKSILESVADAAQGAGEGVALEHHLVERARVRLRRQITQRVATDGRVHAVTLDRNTEALLRGTLGVADGEVALAPDVDTARTLINGLEQHAQLLAARGLPTVVLCPPDLRRALFTFAARFIPDLWVVSARELVPGVQVEPAGVLSAELRRAA